MQHIHQLGEVLKLCFISVSLSTDQAGIKQSSIRLYVRETQVQKVNISVKITLLYSLLTQMIRVNQACINMLSVS